MPKPAGRSRPSTFLRSIAGLGACGALGVAACGVEPAQDLPPGSSFVEQRLTRGGSFGLDLLLVVDDSGSMAQRPYVAEAAAEMVRRLVAPPCVDERGVEVEPPVRAEPGEGCPAGSRPAWNPVEDMNVGVITTSLGAAGSAERCIGDDGMAVTRGDARARLMARATPGGIDDVPTWQARGFLAWDAAQTRRCGTVPDAACPGIADPDELVARVQAIVGGLGHGGCGDEAPLEAAWRFLGDPAPPLGVDATGRAYGIDEDLLARRASFLRPGSAVVVAVITDEDDCSFRLDEVGRYGTDAGSPMPRPRAECAEDPASPCCVSCIEEAPPGCPGDGGCPQPGCQDPSICPENFHADAHENDRRWRCRDPKRRFGLDLLYPPARYDQAFGSSIIDPGRLDLAPQGTERDIENVLASEHEVRLVVIGPVGWEALARRNADGDPDLLHGLDTEGAPRGGYQTIAELANRPAWADLLDDVPGNDAPIRLLTAATVDLAWTWGGGGSVASIDPPRLDGDPRRLDVGFEAAASEMVPSSGCGPGRHRGGRHDAPRLTCGTSCFGADLEADETGAVACHVIEARDSDGDRDPTTAATCACRPDEARLDPEGGAARYSDWIRERMLEEEEHPGYDCLCVVPQVPGDARDATSPRHACQNDELPGEGVDGWCYVDADDDVGNPDLLASCPAAEKRLIRLVGRGDVRPEARLHIACWSE